jgi:uncharacterized membrane protein
MEHVEQQQSAHRSRKHHSSKGRRHRRRFRKPWRAFWVVASAACVSASVFLFLFDDQLRKPATDDGDGDPPTKFMVFAIAAGILALLCVLAAIFGGRKKDQWDVG